MSKLLIRTLDVHDLMQLEAAIDLVENAFADPERYGRERIAREMLVDDPPFYRQFFVAIKGGRIVGVGGVKAADWAAKTHLLYLSAVAPTSAARASPAPSSWRARSGWQSASTRAGYWCRRREPGASASSVSPRSAAAKSTAVT